MSFDWKDYLDLAEELSKGDKEAYYRSSISRACYSAFCIAKNKSSYKEFQENVHENVISEYKNSRGDREKIIIGEKLVNLRRKRNVADYDDYDYKSDEEISIGKKHSERALLIAKEIHKILEEIENRMT